MIGMTDYGITDGTTEPTDSITMESKIQALYDYGNGSLATKHWRHLVDATS